MREEHVRRVAHDRAVLVLPVRDLAARLLDGAGELVQLQVEWPDVTELVAADGTDGRRRGRGTGEPAQEVARPAVERDELVDDEFARRVQLSEERGECFGLDRGVDPAVEGQPLLRDEPVTVVLVERVDAVVPVWLPDQDVEAECHTEAVGRVPDKLHGAHEPERREASEFLVDLLEGQELGLILGVTPLRDPSDLDVEPVELFVERDDELEQVEPQPPHLGRHRVDHEVRHTLTGESGLRVLVAARGLRRL